MSVVPRIRLPKGQDSPSARSEAVKREQLEPRGRSLSFVPSTADPSSHRRADRPSRGWNGEQSIDCDNRPERLRLGKVVPGKLPVSLGGFSSS